MRFLERLSHDARVAPGELQGRVGSLVLEVGAALDARRGREALALEYPERLFGELVEDGVDLTLSYGVVEWRLNGALAQGAHLGKTHAVGR